MLEKRSVSLSGHRTSVALEPEFWAALAALSAKQGITVATLVAKVDETRQARQALASALRIFVLKEVSQEAFF
jgi:predicted DNA-binding ribbon-helix-helix protein